MTGPAANMATTEGSRATNGANSARKVRKSRARMNRTESSSVRVWAWPFWVCWSIAEATPPVRCRARPGGAPDVAKVDRSPATVAAAALSVEPGLHRQLDDGPSGLPVGGGSLVHHRDDPGDRAHGRLGPDHRRVVGPVERTVLGGGHDGHRGGGLGIERKGQSVGADAGRRRTAGTGRWRTSPHSRVPGRQTTRSTATTIHPAMMGQRNRTVNRPRAANKGWSSRDRWWVPWWTGSTDD